VSDVIALPKARKRRNSEARDQVTSVLRGQFEPLRPSTLIDEIYDAICLALRNGSLRPGQPISVRDLAEAFATSAMPVREAIRRLEAQHVLETSPGRAISVPGMNRDDIEEIYTIRISLETLAARKAAERATRKDVAIVRAAYEAMDICFDSKDHSGFMETNYRFHMSVYKAAHMPRLLRLIEPHWLRISPFLWSLVEDQHLRFSMDRHLEALAAIETGNAAALEAAIAADIIEAKRGLLQLVGGDK
jgi:DNA-binding GntR family transcriptional regulator